MLKKPLRLLTLLIAVPGLALGGQSYEIDRSHSHIGFSVRHFGVSNVRGGFGSFGGELSIDEENLESSSVVMRIETASISTDHERRDEHLRSDDFLAVESHPELLFTSKAIERTGEDTFMVTGDLTIRGVTKEIEMPVTLAGPLTDPLGMMRIGIEGGVTIDRQDYGVSWSRVMDNGGLFVGDNVKISFSLEAARPIEEAAADEAAGTEG